MSAAAFERTRRLLGACVDALLSGAPASEVHELVDAARLASELAGTGIEGQTVDRRRWLRLIALRSQLVVIADEMIERRVDAHNLVALAEVLARSSDFRSAGEALRELAAFDLDHDTRAHVARLTHRVDSVGVA